MDLGSVIGGEHPRLVRKDTTIQRRRGWFFASLQLVAIRDHGDSIHLLFCVQERVTRELPLQPRLFWREFGHFPRPPIGVSAEQRQSPIFFQAHRLCRW